MGQINKIPLGFLNMIGSQTGGKNPFVALEEVSPGVDMAPFYHAQGMSVESVNIPLVAFGANGQIVVPEDESWFIYSAYGAMTTNSAADRVRFGIYLRSLTKSAIAAAMVHDSKMLINVAAVAIIASGVNFPEPIPLTSGAEISLLVGEAAGAGLNISLTAVVAKFKS